MFDPNKPHEVCGIGPRTFWSQNGVIYDPSTKQPIDPVSLKAAPPNRSNGLVCKFCGAVRQSPELLMEHLLAMHGEKKTETPEPKAEVKPEQKAEKAVNPPKAEPQSQQLTTASLPGSGGHKAKRSR